jgi:hypothetical protein
MQSLATEKVNQVASVSGDVHPPQRKGLIGTPGKLGAGEAEGNSASAGSSKPEVSGTDSHGSTSIILPSSGSALKRSMLLFVAGCCDLLFLVSATDWGEAVSFAVRSHQGRTPAKPTS